MWGKYREDSPELVELCVTAKTDKLYWTENTVQIDKYRSILIDIDTEIDIDIDIDIYKYRYKYRYRYI